MTSLVWTLVPEKFLELASQLVAARQPVLPCELVGPRVGARARY